MSIVFSSRRTICSSPLDRNGGVAVSEVPHTEKGSNAKPRSKNSALLLLHDALRVDTADALKHKKKVAEETCIEDSKNTHRADAPLRREQPQPSQDTTHEGGGAGVAEAEASDPVDTNIPKARKTPSARTDRGDRIGTTIEAKANKPLPPTKSGGGDGNGPPHTFHKRTPPEDFRRTLRVSMRAIYRNLVFVLVLTCATNILILAIPIYLFQISDRVLTSRSLDTLIMLTTIVAGAVIFQAAFDAVRRFMLMRTAVEVAARLGAPVLSAAAHASLHGNGREYQTLGDLQQVRGFLVSGTLISFLDVPFAPLFILMIFLVHPQLGMIVVVTALLLMTIALINQKTTAKPFAEANKAQSMANQHLDSMSRNSQIINALAMIPEAVRIWGRDTAQSLTWQVRAGSQRDLRGHFARGTPADPDRNPWVGRISGPAR